MGQIKNIKLHIVTDIKLETRGINQSGVTMMTHILRATRQRVTLLKTSLKQNVTTGLELTLTKIVGGVFWFWVPWRLKHDWKTLFTHYDASKVWVIPTDPMYSGGHQHISEH